MISQPTVIDSSLVTPPGSPSARDSYIVGGIGIGDWSGLDQMIVTYMEDWPENNGWVAVVPTDGMIANDETGRSSKGELIAYSATEDEWYPIQDRWSYTEHWTGKYQESGEKIYSKMVSCGTWPNNTTKKWAISASGTIDHSLPVRIEGSAQSGGTLALPVTSSWYSGTLKYGIRINNTDVEVVTTQNLTAYSAEVRLEYCLV